MSFLPSSTSTRKLIPHLKRSIDMLSSKVVVTHEAYNGLSSCGRQRQPSNTGQFVTSGKDDVAFPSLTYSPSRANRAVEVRSGGTNSGFGRSYSLESMIRGESSRMATSDVDLEMMDPRQAGIRKTVEFEVEVNRSRIENCSPSP